MGWQLINISVLIRNPVRDCTYLLIYNGIHELDNVPLT